jgi:DNA-binding NarL/FixJ family response regulator
LVLLTSRNGRGWLEAPWASAIDAVVSRIVDPAVLGMLLHEIAAGRIFHVASHAAPASPTSHISLTGRELEILRLVASGSSNADIGTRLWVTEQTVKFHLSNVYRKLGVANRTQASHYAHVHGLLDRPRSLGSLAVPKAA